MSFRCLAAGREVDHETLKVAQAAAHRVGLARSTFEVLANRLDAHLAAASESMTAGQAMAKLERWYGCEAQAILEAAQALVAEAIAADPAVAPLFQLLGDDAYGSSDLPHPEDPDPRQSSTHPDRGTQTTVTDIL
jgi:hypothetical protein